jgi:hypothetical protein
MQERFCITQYFPDLAPHRLGNTPVEYTEKRDLALYRPTNLYEPLIILWSGI